MPRQRSPSPAAGDHVVDRGDYAPIAQDPRPPVLLVDQADALADHEGRGHGLGEHMLAQAHGRAPRLGAGGRRTLAGHNAAVMAHQHHNHHQMTPNHSISNYKPVVRPEVLYSLPPLTQRSGSICTPKQVEKCVDHLLELLGWGVPLDYLVDLGFSLPGIIWLCAELQIRLTWGIVLKAHEARLPFHPHSIMPHGYTESVFPQGASLT